MKIFLDFDDSLFNTKKFRDGLVKVFLKNGVSRKDFFDTYYDYPKKTSSGLKKYNPNQQIRLLKKNLNIESTKIKRDLQKLIQSTGQFVFSDVNNFLKGFRKENLYLISYGYTDFQRKKIKNCGLFGKFRNVIITDGSKNVVISRFVKRKEIFAFIDDRVENINCIKKYFPNSATFLLKRREGRYNDKKTKEVDFKVRSLNEAEEIIRDIYDPETKDK